jgi:hypothetical protein
LTLGHDDASYHWKLGGGRVLDAATMASMQSWRTWDGDPTPRHYLYRSLWELLRPLPDAQRRQYLSRLSDWAGTVSRSRAEFRALTPSELVSLAASDLMTLGGHTWTHPVLAALPPMAQRDEIRRGKRDLEELTGRRVRSFAYPYGRRTDYSDETVALVREAGFVGACANVPGWVDASTDRFELPRVEVRDWDGEEFARQLSGWLDGRW